MARRFQLVDVFHDQPLGSGNPLAVVFDANGLTSDAMQHLTRWLNFSETTFLLPPTTSEADYRVRIFTAEREMPFAGHPTLGTCHAWLRAGGQPGAADVIVQECGVGLVPIRRSADQLAFAAPPLLRSGAADAQTIAEVAHVLNLDPAALLDVQWADNGPGWVVARLASADEVLALRPLGSYHKRVDIGVVGPYPPGSAAAFELRAFFSNQHGTINEDPVTGSLNASVAQWLLATGRATAPYTASQGTQIGRQGRVYITQDDAGTVWVGGKATTLFSGEMHEF